MAFNEKKISFCIVAMNRLHQLRETLPQNIKDNESYGELEFVILNYNSQDEMGVWIMEELSEYIQSGRLIYYHTLQPLKFNHSHSKNIAFRLASGEIICSVNADHFTGNGFAHYVNSVFFEDENIFLTPLDFHKTRNDYHPPIDVGGKVCVKKSDFIKINGYDEKMYGYGFEDWDFANRLELVGVKRKLIDDFSYLKYISHGQEERYLLNLTNIDGFYIDFLTESSSEFLFLYRDNKFVKGVIIENFAVDSNSYRNAFAKRGYRFPYSISNQGLETGNWNEMNELMEFTKSDGNRFMLQRKLQELRIDLFDKEKGRTFYNILNNQIIKTMEEFVHLIPNREIMENNLFLKRVMVNEAGFGKSILYKNNNLITPLSLI